METRTDYRVNQPDPEQAKVLVYKAMKLAEEGKHEQAIPLIDQALRLDAISGLNGFLGVRQDCYAALGQEFAGNALQMYNYGIALKQRGRYRDAIIAYETAVELDPGALWPANNLAWLLATADKPAVRNGQRSLELATDICGQTQFNCWAFLGTLAVAYAEGGDFEKATRWQLASLDLVPQGHRPDAEIMLRHFKSGKTYIDEGTPPANHDIPTRDELLSPDDISIASLKRVFEAAHFDTEIDGEGDLCVTDRLSAFVRLSGQSQITFFAVLPVANGITSKELLRFANSCNANLQSVRVYVLQKSRLAFDYTIPVNEGITKKAVVRTLRRFEDLVSYAVRQRRARRMFERSDDEA